jgi:nitrogen regulatory protein PII
MNTVSRKLVTIVTEGIIERQVTEELLRLGAHGYTATDARGEGARGRRSAEWEYSRNVRIETVCEATVAEGIVRHLEENYYANFAMIVFLTDVQVLRPEKF